MIDQRRDTLRVARRVTAAERRIAVLERALAGQIATAQLHANELADLRARVAARRPRGGK